MNKSMYCQTTQSGTVVLFADVGDRLINSGLLEILTGTYPNNRIRQNPCIEYYKRIARCLRPYSREIMIEKTVGNLEQS